MRVKKHLAEEKQGSLDKKCTSIAIYMYLHTLLTMYMYIYIYMSQFHTGFYVRGGEAS